MQKAEAGAGGVVGHEDDRDGRAIPDDPCGARNQEAAQEQDVAGPAGAPEDEGLPAPVRVPVMLVPYGPWPGWQAELVISRPSMGLHEFTLSVPFLTPTAAEVGQRFLASFKEYSDIESQLTVNGSCVVVKWIAQDFDRLYTEFTSFLDVLFLIFQMMERLGPQFSAGC
ncbi:EKC/KEOPS complex subunit LAGE3-like [Cavia porcellus]|uniref:EKC/KEOPS complex subunit LAGE3-like n=1 Tax=Cavia porcellus TaxID=10141 RepID=UPI000661980B|nr:EKC/KEOPS complex subunit LAGE3-like [Cavia porcellus]